MDRENFTLQVHIHMKAYFALYFIILNILKLNNKKVKFTLQQANKAQKEKCIPLLFL